MMARLHAHLGDGLACSNRGLEASGREQENMRIINIADAREVG